VSAEVNYVRRSWGNQVVTDNRAYSGSDFDRFSLAGANFPTIENQSLLANWIVTNAQVVPELGRPMAGNAFFTFVNVVDPGTLYGDRLNHVDFRGVEDPAVRAYANKRWTRLL
jgi:hypothetical protein